jgi:hypothetical protein
MGYSINLEHLYNINRNNTIDSTKKPENKYIFTTCIGSSQQDIGSLAQQKKDGAIWKSQQPC